MSGCQNPANPKLKKINNTANTSTIGNNGISPLADELGGIYRVYVQPTARGTVMLDKPSGVYEPDEMVAMTIEADEGYECAYLRAVITDAVNAPVSGNLTDRTRIFRMPTANIYVYAGFVLKSRNSISIGEQVYGKIVSLSHTEAALSNVVTVTVQPDPGHELEAGGIRIIGNKTGAVITGSRTPKRDEYSFSMISEPVTVHVFFFDTTKEQFTVQVDVAKDQSGNSVVVKGLAAAGETVGIAMYLKDDHILLEKPTVTFKGTTLSVTQNTIDPTKWTFTMPITGIVTGDSLLVKASWRMIPMYVISAGIAETSAGEGRFIVEGLNNAGKIASGGNLTLTLKINDAENYYYRQGSVEVLNAASINLASRLTLVEDNWNGAVVVWKFAVPDTEPTAMTETLRVSAVIDSIPAHPVAFAGLDDNGRKAGTIEIAPVAAGKDITAGELKVREGKITTAVLYYDEEDYTLAQGSFKVSKTSGGEIQAQREGETKLTFLMHPQAVTVSANLTAKPNIPITKKNDNTGTIRFEYMSETGSKENAREGYIVSILPVPVAGYHAAPAGPTVTPAVSLQKNANNVWTFTMPAYTVDVQWNFPESGNIEIFKGGPKLPELAISNSRYPFATNGIGKDILVDWTNTNGRTPGTAAIRVGVNPRATAAGVAYAGELGFSLVVPSAIDVSWIGAVSFYMKRATGNGPTPGLGTTWVGFGDDGNQVIWYGDGNNSVIAVSENWKRYIIPVPASRDGIKMKRVFFWKGNANAEWLIDDIEFISAAQIALTDITVPATYSAQVVANNPIEAYTLANYATGGIAFTYGVLPGRGDPVTATMYNTPGDRNVPYNWKYWVPSERYTYKVYGADANLSGSILTPLRAGGDFELTISLSQIESNKMSIEIERDDLKVLENFEFYAPNRGQNGYWDEMLWREWGGSNPANMTSVYSGEHSGVYKYLEDPANSTNAERNNQKDPPRAGRTFAAVDISGYQTLSFWIKALPASTEANALSFYLSNGASGNNQGTLRAATFRISTNTAQTGANGFKRIDIPLANFTGLNLKNVTGWAFSVNSMEGCNEAGTTTYEYQYALDEITVKK